MAGEHDVRGADRRRELRWHLNDWEARSRHPCDADDVGCGRWRFCPSCDGTAWDWGDADYILQFQEGRLEVVRLIERHGGNPRRYAEEILGAGLVRDVIELCRGGVYLREVHNLAGGLEPRPRPTGGFVRYVFRRGEELISAAPEAHWALLTALAEREPGAAGCDLGRPEMCGLIPLVAPSRAEAVGLLSRLLRDADVRVRARAAVVLRTLEPSTPGLRRGLCEAIEMELIEVETDRWWEGLLPEPVLWADVPSLVAAVRTCHPDFLRWLAGHQPTAGLLYALRFAVRDFGVEEDEPLRAALAAVSARLSHTHHAALPDEDLLLLALWKSPADETLRLAYADWLDEHGAPDRAAAVRLSCVAIRDPVLAHRFCWWLSGIDSANSAARGRFAAGVVAAGVVVDPNLIDAAAGVRDRHWLGFLTTTVEAARPDARSE